MQLLGQGALHKMHTRLEKPVEYSLQLNAGEIGLNSLLGKQIRLKSLGVINCLHCGRKTNKSFSQGYCYPCFKKLPQCDTCIMSPERCHYSEGTCRDAQWGEQHCFTPHIVYLANSSGVKVGITRATQVPTRWIDQGAVSARPIFSVQTRKQSGLVESLFKTQVADKTNWRAMLKGEVEELDLQEVAEDLTTRLSPELEELRQSEGEQSISFLDQALITDINYPVLEYPSKIKTHNLDKTPEVEGTLLGIKGQYLILDTGVINIRKFTSYNVQLFSE